LGKNTLVVNLNDYYLTYTDIRERPSVQKNRLTLSKIDNEFYKELLKNNKPKPKAESHKRIQQAWDTIDKRLIRNILKNKTLTVSDKIDHLQEIKDKLIEQSVVIHITCDDLDGTYQLFEVLNDRGRELATGDFLRSTTLELLEKNPELQNNISEIWDKILSKTDNESFLKSYLTSHIAKIKRTNLHKQFKEANLFPSSKPEDIDIYEQEKIKNRLINLESQYEIFEMISEGNWPYLNSSCCLWEKKRLSMLIGLIPA